MNFNSKQLFLMAAAARLNALRAILAADSGHAGIALGAADIMTALYANFINPNTDKFVLSAGHGSALLYSVLKLSGHKIAPMNSFRKLGGLPGHPEYGIDGVAATTGPLGQGVANAVGMALSKKYSRVYCLCSDGDLMEGVAQESIAFAGRNNLNNFMLLWDDNGISIDGAAQTDMDVPLRMRAAGFDVYKCNGNDFDSLCRTLRGAHRSRRPVFIQCKTTIGLGAPAQNTAAAHAMTGGLDALAAQLETYAGDGEELWKLVRPGIVQKITMPEIPPIENSEITGGENLATRVASGRILKLREKYFAIGSADLTASTGLGDIANVIRYGVREHAMAGIMNGLALSGLRPVGGTFLAFSDYARPAVRLGAMMKLPVIYVFTHDSITVGEDGPTHQPIEQLASLRLIPNILVFRPCDIYECAAAWNIIFQTTDRPCAMVLSRQNLPQIFGAIPANAARGAYIVADAARPKTTLLATGSEVSLALAVAKKLGHCRVVSVLSVELFRAQPAAYKNKILQGRVVALEAGRPECWFEFADAVVGLDRFGLSGGGAATYAALGFDADEIVRELKSRN
ncbi:MAG: hypothetical protein LBO08_02830 [Rickettsiales bacterium]|jgi:transketolase|nr:hypothetical protein [Rickettsiales bacterium]